MAVESRIFDWIVVGAGTAGMTFVARADGRLGTIGLVEAGPASRPPASRIPARYPDLFGSHVDWQYVTTPQAALAGRQLAWPRGRMVGGSSAMNAMIHFAPRDSDLRAWSQSVSDWTPESFQPALRWLQTRWGVMAKPCRLSAVTRAAVEAGRTAGFDLAAHQCVIRRGRRLLPETLIDTAARRSLEIFPDCTAERLLIEEGTAHRVLTRRLDGRTIELNARRGIILSAGTIGTPMLLWRSGIGPAEDLRACGISPLIPQSNIGPGLQDHLLYPVIYAVADRFRFPPRASLAERLRWQSTGTGSLASNLAEAGGFVRVGGDGDRDGSDEVQIHLTPTHYLKHPQPDSPAAMTIGITPTRPHSRGVLKPCRDDQGRLHPALDPRYLSDARDVAQIESGIEIARRIAATPPLRTAIIEELLPGGDAVTKRILRTIARYSQTLYHPVGTVKAADAASAAVDSQLRIRTIPNLYVADASVLPTLPACNPHASVMLIAARLAEQLAGLQ